MCFALDLFAGGLGGCSCRGSQSSGCTDQHCCVLGPAAVYWVQLFMCLILVAIFGNNTVFITLLRFPPSGSKRGSKQYSARRPSFIIYSNCELSSKNNNNFLLVANIIGQIQDNYSRKEICDIQQSKKTISNTY